MQEKTPLYKRKSSRLRQMVGILRRHDLLHGLSPEKLRRILEDFGPTYVKLGQIMSMRNDMLPQNFCDELGHLRDQVNPVSFDEILQVVERELACPWRQVFSSIEAAPLGSASIAQVHSAVMLDGRSVVLKVQRPGIFETMEQDIQLLRRACGLLHVVSGVGDVIRFEDIIEELWAAAQQELDFLQEANNLREFSRLNAQIVYVTCPKVLSAFTTSRLLVMERISGIPLDHREDLRQEGYDLHEIGVKLTQSYLKQVLDDAFFHADPHPGNIWIREGKIVFLDLGMVGRLTPRERQLFGVMVTAVVEGDVVQLKDAILVLGNVRQRVDHALLYTDIDDLLTRYGSTELGGLELGQVIEDLLEVAHRHSISMPPSITMLARGIVTLEGVLTACCPDVNYIQLLAMRVSGNFFQRLDWQKELKDTSWELYQSIRKSVNLPGQFSDLLKLTAKGQTKLNLELTGSDEPLRKLDKMVDKLVISMLITALLIGSSLICTTGMTPQFLGIPLLGVLGYLFALGLTGFLLGKMMRRKKRRKR